MSVAPQAAINYAPDSSNLAFAFWGGDFWLFVGPGAYDRRLPVPAVDAHHHQAETEQFEIVGAGVSTCAPTTPPQ